MWGEGRFSVLSSTAVYTVEPKQIRYRKVELYCQCWTTDESRNQDIPQNAEWLLPTIWQDVSQRNINTCVKNCVTIIWSTF
jgi:hypothetical protein